MSKLLLVWFHLLTGGDPTTNLVNGEPNDPIEQPAKPPRDWPRCTPAQSPYCK